MTTHGITIRAKEILDTEGWRSLILKTVKKIGHVLFVTNHAHWFVRDLSEKIERPSPRLAVAVDASSNEETIQWLRKNHHRFGWMYVPEEVSLARACGHYLVGVRLEGMIVGYIKIARERGYVLDYGAELSLPPGDAFVYDTFVLPKYRGKRIASFLIAEAMAFLKEEGFRRLWCHIPVWNAASISAFSRSGFRKIAHIRFVKIFGCPFFSISPGQLIRRVASQEGGTGYHHRQEQTVNAALQA